MADSVQRLAQLVDDLEADGGSSERLHVARCALAFKRSWVELAAALHEVRQSGAYQQWGYDDLLSYCAGELGIRGPTVDKLLVSYATLSKHAPSRLQSDAEGPIPSYQALDYFARVTGEPRADGSMPRNAPEEPPNEEVMTQLHEAVFEQGQSAQQLRRHFDPLVRPRSPEEQQLWALRRASATAQRLLEQLSEVEGLNAEQVDQLQTVIDDLQAQIEELVSELQSAEAA
jgi:uncharacterized coiled-coil protein SlyX